MDNGAYTSWGPTIPVVMMRTVSGHYRVPVVDYKAQAIYTNNPYAGSFRGYGNVQGAWATAQQMDMLADLVDIDPLEFHLKNAQRSGEVTPQKSVLRECAFVECLEDRREGERLQPQAQGVRGGAGQARPLQEGHRPRLLDPQRRRRQDPQVGRHRHYSQGGRLRPGHGDHRCH
jgi:CO/xanthine dehydrogenase Mo-binding subunit